MKYAPSDLRYLSSADLRVLAGVEQGTKNHELVPTKLIASLAGLRSGGVVKCLGELSKRKLVARMQNAKYEGYRLTYGGYDYLASSTLSKRGAFTGVGSQLGVGKESDIYLVSNEEGTVHALKLHRLGRTSFRTVKSKRDYLRTGQSAGNWMYLSSLAAKKEFAFMKVLHENGFPVPRPVDQSRHAVVMELIDAFPLRQLSSLPDPAALYHELMKLITRLAQSGLIHGDFNEYNILIRDTRTEEEREEDDARAAQEHEGDDDEIPELVDGDAVDGAASAASRLGNTVPSVALDKGKAKEVDADAAEAEKAVEEEQQEQARRRASVEPILIDFPQMVSTSHPQAAFFFNRDVGCIRRFFTRRFGFTSPLYPTFNETVNAEGEKKFYLDVEVEASGWYRSQTVGADKEMSAEERERARMAEDLLLNRSRDEEEEGGRSDDESDELVDEDEDELEVDDDSEQEEDEEEDEEAASEEEAGSEADEGSQDEEDDGESKDALATLPAKLGRALPTRPKSSAIPAELVAAEAARKAARQSRKHHAGAGGGRAQVGRRKGSKKGQGEWRREVKAHAKGGDDF